MSFLIQTELMQHQKEAVAKMLPSKIGALFMDMGTGKTLCTIKLVNLRLNKIDKVIYFCPVSLKKTIAEQIFTHTNLNQEQVYMFSDKTNERNIPNDKLFYICGIESMSDSKRVILTINKLITDKSFVVVDESTFIKGHRSWRTLRITEYSAISRYRLIMTGTPLTQGIVDLFAQMRFLSPKILGYRSFYSFANNHLEYSNKYKGLIVRSHNTEELAIKIAPYTYQVTKAECLDLPDKLYTTYYYSMCKEQRHYYELAKYEILYDIPDNYLDNTYTIFRLFTALQTILSGFWNRDSGVKLQGKETLTIDHKRIDTLLEAINHIPDDKKIIIWCKFQHDIKSIIETLNRNFPDHEVAQFHGQLAEKARNKQVSLFRKKARFFVATPATGGHGLTLTEAHYVIFYNNGFKYSQRLQAEDRAMRIGQRSNVTYVDIVCSDSIDERIHKALRKKENVLRAFIGEVEKVKKENLKERLMQL